MRGLFRQFVKDESGATSIEYALIAAFIGLMLIVAATQIGIELKATFTEVDDGLKSRPQ